MADRDPEPQEQDDERPAIGVERLQREDPPPAFAKGWRWPLIFLVVGVIALAAFGALTAIEPPPLPPAPMPAPPPMP